ncbi:MAG: hypothetical protein R3F35_00315 [Myxococcota bacterium]
MRGVSTKFDACTVGQPVLRRRRAAIRGAGVGLAVLVGAASVVRADPPVDPDPAGGSVSEGVIRVPGAASGRGQGASGSAPGLDDLLRLPNGFETQTAERPVAGASEDEWRRRFTRAERSIIEARERLADTKRELDGMAETGGASQWSVAPPGASAQQSTSPLSFKLRQELQRNREDLETAEKALRELRIEADLAGVPAEWRVVSSLEPGGAPAGPEARPGR